MTPLEKKALILAVQNAPSGICECKGPDDGSCKRCKSVSDFLAGFRAALELAEVNGMAEALRLVDSLPGIAYAPELNRAKSCADTALTAWRSFRGEK